MKKSTPPASKTPTKGATPAKGVTFAKGGEKLTYFDGRGRAELSRLILAAAGTKYEDIRISQDDWPKMKAKMPNGQLPTLEDSGVVMFQSMAIARHLARKYDYYGKNLKDYYEVDMIMDTVTDLRSSMFNTFFGSEEKKAEATKKFKENDLPAFFTLMEKIASENTSGYLVGGSLTLADLAVYDVLEGVLQQDKGALEKQTGLLANRKKVGEMKNIKEYVAKRKATPF